MNLGMIPYVSPLYLVVLAIFLLPLCICLYKGHRALPYQTVLIVLFLSLSFTGSASKQGIALVCFAVWQTLLVKAYLAYRSKKDSPNSSVIFVCITIASILPLVLVKVWPVFDETGFPWGFLGISYLTFRAVQMILETRDGLIKSCTTLDFLRFLLFFPTIASGPIDRYRSFEKAMHTVPVREEYTQLIARGINRIFLGCLYKYIIAYGMGLLMDIVSVEALSKNASPIWLLAYMYIYSLHLFFDFAGYSLFAVGASNLMGYDIQMNFHYPFISHNIKDFWNRWHMSLSFWFRDYVYMRLLYFFTKKKVFRSNITTSNICYFALFLLMGLWHGFTWYYVLYGAYHATLICLTDVWLRFKKKHGKSLPSNRFTLVLSVVLTFHAVCFGFLIFSGFLWTYFGK